MVAGEIGDELEREELRALLQLRALPGISDRELRQLLAYYGSPRAALRAPAAELGPKAAGVRGTPGVLGRVERSLRTIEEQGIEVLVESDARYPDRLRELHDPPPVLFARGRLELLEEPALAIVGARRPTAYGRDAARVLAYGVARSGLVVVSGAARGIDGVAHEAALDAGGGTIGVLGCGIDVVYPREHIQLQERMANQGLLLSEFAPGEPPKQYHFPRRNRIIAALAQGVLVVEASNRSGSLITVNHATDLGREVLAVPGPIGRELSAGTNELIRDGAAVVLGVEDILATLGISAPKVLTPERAMPEQATSERDMLEHGELELDVPQRGMSERAAVDRITPGRAAPGSTEPGIAALDSSASRQVAPKRPGVIGGDGKTENNGGGVKTVKTGNTENYGNAGNAGIAGNYEAVAVPGVELPPPAGLGGDALRLWHALDGEPRHASVLATGCGLDPATTLVHLLELELGGHARQLAGLRFVRVAMDWWTG